MAQVVLNVMYNAPEDPDAFEAYYAQTHLPIAGQIPSVEKLILLRGLPGPDGSAPSCYRIAQLFFADGATMQAAMATPEGLAAVSDLSNFATDGFHVLVTEVA